MTTIKTIPLTAAAFAPFGDVIELQDDPSFMINAGMCGRHHDLANLDFGEGEASIGLADGKPYALPLPVNMVERHPLGSQAFIPLSTRPYLVVVAADNGGVPATPVAFITNGRQGVNYHRNIWHGVLTPLGEQQQFVIVDRVGEGDNLQEHHFTESFTVVEGKVIAAS